jgi:hypothetical protein
MSPASFSVLKPDPHSTTDGRLREITSAQTAANPAAVIAPVDHVSGVSVSSIRSERSRDDRRSRRLGSEQVAVGALVDVRDASGLVLIGEVAQRLRTQQLVVEHDVERGG